jgi:hypothetical protein
LGIVPGPLPQLRPIARGLYIKQVASTTLLIASFTESFEDFDPKAGKALRIEWAKVPGNPTILNLENQLCQIDPDLRNVHPGRSCFRWWLLDTSTLAQLMPCKVGASMPLR